MNRKQLGKIKLLIDFINKYGYCVARTFNDNADNLLYYTDGEEYTGPESDRFSWTCFFSAQFLNLLFKFNNKDLVLQGEKSFDSPKKREKLTSETFIREFVPGTGFYFEIEDHHFHIFYFGEDSLYIADYYAEVGRDFFKFTPIQKSDVIRFIDDHQFRPKFLVKPDNPDSIVIIKGYDISIFDIQVHKIETIPSLNDLLTIIKQSHNMEPMIENLRQDGCEDVEPAIKINAWLG